MIINQAGHASHDRPIYCVGEIFEFRQAQPHGDKRLDTSLTFFRFRRREYDAVMCRADNPSGSYRW